MDKQHKPTSIPDWVTPVVVLVLITGGVVWFKNHASNESPAQKYANCTQDAGKLYDEERQTITSNANGYSRAEQAGYYQRTEYAYTTQLQACKQEYGQ